ncbi:MAG: peptidyl-prolyl cis-trans isomerase [Pseudomonadota bacterium]
MEFFRSLVSNKFVGSILLGLIILGMAVWGTENIFSGNFGASVVKVGERGITQQELDEGFERTLRFLRSQSEANRTLTRQQAVQQGLLDREISQQSARLMYLGFAREIGADASSEALAKVVRENESFNSPITGQFDLETYRRVLADNRFSQVQYENGLKDDLTIGYVQDAIEGAVRVPSDLARLQAIFNGEERRIAWIPLREGSLPEPAEPTEEELLTFFETQQAAFTIPERRQISLLSVSTEDFLHLGEFTEDDISAYYEATKTRRLATPEARTFVEAIFVDEDAALNAFGVLAGGGDIDAASASSISTRSAMEDEIGVGEFRDAIFATRATEGSVVGPFETPGGWLVGKVEAITPGEPKPLEEVREELVAELAAENAETEYYNAFNRFDDLIGQGLTIEEIGVEIGAPVLSFLPVDRRGTTGDGDFVGAFQDAPQALGVAFDLPENVVSDRIDGEDTSYVVSVDGIQPSAPPAFEDVRETVRGRLMATRQSEALQTVADAVRSTLESGVSTLEEQAELYDSAVVRPEASMSRTSFDQTLPRPVLQAAFDMDQEGDVTVAQGLLPGERFIVQLESLTRPSPEDLDLLAIVSGAQLTEGLRGDLQQAFQQELVESLEIETNAAALAAYRAAILDDQ